MTLPETLTLVRHGYSEANAVIGQIRQKTLKELPAGLFERHDANMRLTALGVSQAEQTGDWFRAHGKVFDRFYVSPHTRTRETAYHLHLNGEWRIEDRIRERDWGEIHYVKPDLSDPLTDDSRKNKELFQWYWKPQAGESLATGVRLRFESMVNSLYRKTNTEHALMVTHEELIKTARFVLERLTPDRWEAQDKDPAFKIQNTMILEYTRRNPFNADEPLHTSYRWRRAICPWDESLSWNEGKWVPTVHQKYSDDDLLVSVQSFAPLF